MVLLELFEAVLHGFDTFFLLRQVVGEAHECIQPDFVQLIHIPGGDHVRAVQLVDDARVADRFQPLTETALSVRQAFQRAA